MEKRFKEFKVNGIIEKGKFSIKKKEPTERGHVVISERDADINNRQTRFTGLHYELDKKFEDKKKQEIQK